MEEYKVNILKDILKDMKSNNFYLCRLKGDNQAAINIDSNAIKLLIDITAITNRCTRSCSGCIFLYSDGVIIRRLFLCIALKLF
jgi:tRNA(Phe) wybutosine-synthesizing methylase Tyw3